MLNLLAKAKTNAFSNGISLGGNTLGAILVFISMGVAFKTWHYSESLLYLSFFSGGILLLATCLYIIPQRHISMYADDDVKQTSRQTGNYLIIGLNLSNWFSNGKLFFLLSSVPALFLTPGIFFG